MPSYHLYFTGIIRVWVLNILLCIYETVTGKITRNIGFIGNWPSDAYSVKSCTITAHYKFCFLSSPGYFLHERNVILLLVTVIPNNLWVAQHADV